MNRHYDCDVLVIGAGMGGGMIARALTEAGVRVTLLEKGLAGERSDAHAFDMAIDDPAARAAMGFWPEPALTEIDGRNLRQFLPLGSGLGGSSAFYAATLERPARHDIDDSAAFPHPTGGWPVGWDSLAPWFDKAQSQLMISGTPDPLDDRPMPALRPPPAPMGAGDAAMVAQLKANGLHPYHLHSAVAGLDGCASCLGRKCPRLCKMDGRSAGVEPALATGLLRLETGAEVTALTMDGACATGALYHQAGREHYMTARHVVLAAGALSSPRLLLASRGAGNEAGIGNAHDQVGRHLMFHLDERFLAWPPRGVARSGPAKAVGLRDFYHVDGQRLGMVQAMGIDAGYREILHYLRLRMAEKGMGGRLWRQAARIPAGFAAYMVGTAKLFVGLLEDMPSPDNRVLFDPDAPQRIHLTYTTSAEAMQRRRLFRRKIAQGFKGQRVMFLSDRPEPNLGHACGTLRMGTDPKSSVTDGDGRVHATDNLWVADASAFPTSMGVNPSLTIAALALRQAQTIKDRLAAER